jgi:hypothetical protein
MLDLVQGVAQDPRPDHVDGEGILAPDKHVHWHQALVQQCRRRKVAMGSGG